MTNMLPQTPPNLEDDGTSRRELLRAFGFFGLLAMTGCGGGSSGASPGQQTTSTYTPPTTLPSTGTPSPFRLISAVGGTNLPFCFGHAFRQGDVPANLIAIGNSNDWQCTPLTYWPDGSLRHGVIAGHINCAANTVSTITFSIGVPQVGSAPTESMLATVLTNSPVSVNVGGQTISLNNLVGTQARQRTVCAGPVLSNWIYMQTLPGNNQMSVWFDVRLFNDKSVEIFPWVENGWLLAAGDTDYNLPITVSIRGHSVFSQTLDICNHTRIPLVSGTATQCSYWLGTNPQIVPLHDTNYLMATKLVSNYPFGVNASPYQFTESYTPNTLADVNPAMASTGYEPFIGILPEWSALHLAGGADLRAYNYVITNGLSAGSWSVHYRDQATNDVPTFVDYPQASINWSGTPTIPPSSGKVNQSGGYPAIPDTAHQPSLAYYPWLLTARWFFLDELLLWNFWNYLQSNYTTRNGTTNTGASYVLFDGQIRARGWNFRTLAQSLTAVPASHASYQSLVNAWAANMSSYCALYVEGTLDGGIWKNNLGCLGLYSGNATGSSPYGTNSGSTTYWWDAPWMQATIIMSVGYAWDLGLPMSAQAQSDHQVVRDFGYSQIVGRAGPANTPGVWDYRNFSEYQIPFSYPATVAPGTWFPNWDAAYAVYEQYGNNNFTALPVLSPSDTNMYYGASPLPNDGGAWTTSSGTAFHMAALTYAVEHGATGAAAGWKRIVSSPSFGYATSGVNGYLSNPLWALYPRNPPV